MTLQPFFSLSPLKPYQTTFNPAQPNAPRASARFLSSGGVSKNSFPYSLEDQHNNNELILGYSPVDPANQAINDIKDVYGYSSLNLIFYGINVRTDNQYLLLFSLRNLSGSPQVQFFVGTKLVRIEKVDGEEQIAIVLDVPGDSIPSYVIVRVASILNHATIGFKGVDCYLL